MVRAAYGAERNSRAQGAYAPQAHSPAAVAYCPQGKSAAHKKTFAIAGKSRYKARRPFVGRVYIFAGEYYGNFGNREQA